MEISSALISLASTVRTHGQSDLSSFIEQDAIAMIITEKNNVGNIFVSDNCFVRKY